MKLTDSIRYLKGVGPAREALFNKLGISNISDLIYYFPRDYEDRTKTKKIIELVDGEKMAFEAEILGRVTQIFTRSRMKIYKVTVADETSRATLTWFNTDYIKNILKPNQRYVFYGQIERTINGIEVKNPVFEIKGTEKKTGRILPIYPSTKDLTQNVIRDTVKNVFDNLEESIAEILPHDVMQKYELIDINSALKSVHFPESEEGYMKARKRLAFEELLVLQLGLMQLKNKNSQATPGIKFEIKDEVYEFIKELPFELTNAQRKVIDAILKDMSSENSMRRLLQGDVGSGKTIVALISMLNIVRNGYQAVLMAPTSILAEQHFNTFNQMLEEKGIRVGLLTSSLTAKEKRDIKERIELGLIDIVIGTHAVLEDDVRFSKLGLVITDEQHRFGVNQRAKLCSKGLNPDTLVMTATPIPRTLALILYGDLDISIIDELPPNRQKIDTYLVDKSLEERIGNFIEKEITAGRQAYVVCPLIEESEEMEIKLKTVEDAEVEYKQRFPNFNVEILHGKMKPALKEEIMHKFNNKEIDILISTTVIEVGVNVPNATLMIIENAERFGLAALHQLRGRVGRGQHKSYCILKCGIKSKDTIERMQIMTKTDNGFKIAEKDLELRGPGEFLGIRQHGMPELKVANIFADAEVLEQTTFAAKEILAKPEIYQELLNKVDEKFTDITL
jgi:ATP-dependent DNA helicase RecG